MSIRSFIKKLSVSIAVFSVIAAFFTTFYERGVSGIWLEALWFSNNSIFILSLLMIIKSLAKVAYPDLKIIWILNIAIWYSVVSIVYNIAWIYTGGWNDIFDKILIYGYLVIILITLRWLRITG